VPRVVLRALARADRSRARLVMELESQPRQSLEETTVSSFDFWSMAFVFVLATFVGLQVIQGVSRLLHTPLMSLTNAISAIAVVGSIIIAGEQKTLTSAVLGAIAVAASVTNIVSGFLITDRMLRMFRERGSRGDRQ
jgi:NAD(P) transhydrogenase subunit alpha